MSLRSAGARLLLVVAAVDADDPRLDAGGALDGLRPALRDSCPAARPQSAERRRRWPCRRRCPSHPQEGTGDPVHGRRRFDPVDRGHAALSGDRPPARPRRPAMPESSSARRSTTSPRWSARAMPISPEAGDTATIVKLARVAMLLPVILAVGLLIAVGGCAGGRDARRSCPGSRPPSRCWSSSTALLPLPAWVRDAGNGASRFCLVSAIAALGHEDPLQGHCRRRLAAGHADGAGDRLHRRRIGAGHPRSEVPAGSDLCPPR